MPNVGTSPDGNYVQYGGSVNVGGDRNWRNNNPGNIEAGTFANSQGAIGSDGRFAIFPDPETGMRALQNLLTSDGYQALTIEQAMERYAPPDENDTNAYTSFITQQVGVDPLTPMSELTADQLASFANAIETYEGGTAGTTYQEGDANLPSWAQDLFDGSAPDSPDPTTDPAPDPTPDPTPDPPSDPIPTPLPATFRTPCPALHRIPFQIRLTQHQWIQLLIQRQTLRLVQRLILVHNPTLVVIAEEMDRRTPVVEAMEVVEAMAEEEVVVVKEVVAAAVVGGTETDFVSYEE
jgi:hypothetical protein